NMIPDHPERAGEVLEGATEQARLAIIEGRDAVQGLRSFPTSDITAAITALAKGLISILTDGKPPPFRVGTQGPPGHFWPVLRDEIYRIAGEALRNAFRHAHARRVEVELSYDERQFGLRVRDDGAGIDPKILHQDRRPGHYGLPGMHERAIAVGGQLTITSEP